MPSPSRIGKSTKGTYDPQVGAAAEANAKIAERAQTFSEDYYNKWITPLLQKQVELADKADTREDELFKTNKEQFDQADQRYKKFGIPAEDAYYKQAADFSAPEQQEADARAALGDQRVAQQTQQGMLMRKLQAMGVDPTSPGAVSAMGDMAVQNAAIEAGAQTRAREGAKRLGMQLTSDAANFGRGGTSQVLAFGQAASGNNGQSLGLNSQALAGVNSGAGVVQTGQQIGLKGYTANLDAYTTLNKASMESQGAAAAGLGNFLGTIGGAAITAGMKPSDRRLKKNIERLTTLSSGIGVYQYNYVWEPDGGRKQVGFMADEVEKVWPHAVITDHRGLKQVDYSKVPF